ncbi:MAG: hypothetical protein WC528_02405 [Patescibacteria group bacterium]
MDITLDFSTGGYADSYLGPFYTLWIIIAHGGWVALVIAFIIGFFLLWLEWRRNLFDAKVKFILLAIDIPKENEQTPKAVENIFSHLHGIQKRGNFIEKYIGGYTQQCFSLEIISIGGYIQFLIRTPEDWRDLAEAAIYAQYPNAEITEVEDYTKDIKIKFPNDDYDIWGTHMTLEKKDVYPIKTYVSFEDPSTKETFKDPMASLLEIMSRLKEGEQIWIQMVISPEGSKEWRDSGIRVIKKLIGAKTESKGKDLFWLPKNVIHGVSESLYASIISPSDLYGSTAQKEILRWPTMIQHLSPSERSVVEAVGIKISKIAFKTKMRVIYLGKKEVFSKNRFVPAIMGALKQYNTLDINGLKADAKTKTKVDYPPIKSIIEWRQNRRKWRVMWGYKYRSSTRGRCKFVLNIEELATLFHFPIMTVKAPMVKKTEARKAEPPVSLPLEQAYPLHKKSEEEISEEEKIPQNIPFI